VVVTVVALGAGVVVTVVAGVVVTVVGGPAVVQGFGAATATCVAITAANANSILEPAIAKQPL